MSPEQEKQRIQQIKEELYNKFELVNTILLEKINE
jgi:hypothetical protein